jgi:hypothetical protein
LRGKRITIRPIRDLRRGSGNGWKRFAESKISGNANPREISDHADGKISPQRARRTQRRVCRGFTVYCELKSEDNPAFKIEEKIVRLVDRLPLAFLMLRGHTEIHNHCESRAAGFLSRLFIHNALLHPDGPRSDADRGIDNFRN